MKTKNIAAVVIAFVTGYLVLPLHAGSVSKTHTFSNGGTISASEMNTNFDTLYTEINAKDTRIATLEAKVESTSRTVNLNAGMTLAQLQAAIDGVGRYLASGVTITFQFADGGYNYASTIKFAGFNGQGAVVIQGNDTEADSAHTDQAVNINTSSQAVNAVSVENNTVPITLKKLRFAFDAASGKYGLVILGTTYAEVRYCYAIGNGTGNAGSRGFMVNKGSNAYLLGNYASDVYAAVGAGYGSSVSLDNNQSTTTTPIYGMIAIAGKIAKVGAPYFTGSTANESASLGGQIP